MDQFIPLGAACLRRYALDGIRTRVMFTIQRFGPASSAAVTPQLVVELSDDNPGIVRAAASTLVGSGATRERRRSHDPAMWRPPPDP